MSATRTEPRSALTSRSRCQRCRRGNKVFPNKFAIILFSVWMMFDPGGQVYDAGDSLSLSPARAAASIMRFWLIIVMVIKKAQPVRTMNQIVSGHLQTKALALDIVERKMNPAVNPAEAVFGFTHAQ